MGLESDHWGLVEGYSVMCKIPAYSIFKKKMSNTLGLECTGVRMCACVHAYTHMFICVGILGDKVREGDWGQFRTVLNIMLRTLNFIL